MKDAARWTALLALFAIPFLPLYVSNELFFPFITGKNFAFRILVEIAFVAYGFLALVDRRYRPKYSHVLAAFGGLVAWTAVANMLGVLPMKAFWSNFERMDGWVTLVHLFLFFVVAGAVLSVERLWRRWWLFFVSVAAVVCLYGLVQLGGGAEIHQGGVRLTGTLGNAIYLAVYLMFAIFISCWLAVRSKGWLRWSLIGFIALAFVIMFFTGSRGPLVGLIAGTISGAGLWLFLARKEWGKGAAATGIKIALGSVAALVLAGGLLFSLKDSDTVTGNPFLSRAASLFSVGSELEVREKLWGIAFKGVAEDPITGWGQEGFNQVFNKYYDPSLYDQEAWFDRAHNMYIDWFVAGGIPAGLLFLALLGLGFTALVRLPGASRAERVFLVSAFVAYAVQAIVVFDNLFSYVPLMMLLAMAHAQSGRNVRALSNAPEMDAESTRGYAVASAGAIILIAIIWTVNVSGIQAANHLVYALSSGQSATSSLARFEEALAADSFASQEIREQFSSAATSLSENEAIPEQIRKEFLVRAAEEMNKEVASSPNDARLRVQYASLLKAAGDIEGALTQYQAALALSPKKQAIYVTRGFMFHDLGDNESAQRDFIYAYELDPSFPSLNTSIAAGLIITGDVAKGKEIAMEVFSTTTPDDDSLFLAYYRTKAWNDLIAVARAGVLARSNEPEAHYRLAQAYAAAGRMAEARAQIVQTVKSFPATRELGEALMQEIFGQAR
ncbi:MAG TPA: O-antigen ligase family protein [Candidatus Paceibacterota bacterium]